VASRYASKPKWRGSLTAFLAASAKLLPTDIFCMSFQRSSPSGDPKQIRQLEVNFRIVRWPPNFWSAIACSRSISSFSNSVTFRFPRCLLAGHAIRPTLHDAILQRAGIAQRSTDPEPKQAQQHKENERDDDASSAGRLVVEAAILGVVRSREEPRDEP